MKKNKNKTKKFSRLSALFFASILLFQIINPVVANAIDVSAKREEIYNKLKEAAELNMLMNSLRKCFKGDKLRKSDYGVGGIQGKWAKKGEIFYRYGHNIITDGGDGIIIDDTTYNTALWVEDYLGAGEDGGFWCHEGQPNGKSIYQYFASFVKSRYDISNAELLCNGGAPGLIQRVSDSEHNCSSFDDDDGKKWYGRNPDWETHLKRIYEKIKEASGRNSSDGIGNKLLPAYEDIGKFNSVDGYFNYLKDFNTRCEADKVSGSDSGTTKLPLVQFDKSDKKLVATRLYYHVKKDESWKYSLAEADANSCSKLLTRIEELRGTYNGVYGPDDVETDLHRHQGYQGVLVYTLGQACKNATIGGENAWESTKKKLEEVIADSHTSAEKLEEANRKLEELNKVMSEGTYVKQTGNIDGGDDEMTLECYEPEAFSIEVEQYTDPDDDLDDPGTSGDNGPTCYDRAASLGWILCPIIEQVADAIQYIDEQIIMPFLELDVGLFASNNATHNVWSKIRDMANIGFIIFFIFVIFSQLTGVGIDNYGIKKVLPKLIVGAILINLSYVICQLSVDLSNILGYGIKSIFEGLAPDIDSITVAQEGATGTGSTHTVAGTFVLLIGIVAAITTAAILALGPHILIPVFMGLISVIIAIIFCFILLAVRKAFAVLLVIVSPLAFMCYILPNTKSLFDKWFSAFKAMLLAFPICSAMIYGGQFVGSLLIDAADETNVPFTLALCAAVISIMPVFMIPKVIRGSMAMISGGLTRMQGALTGRARGAAGRRLSESSLMNKARYRAQMRSAKNTARQSNYNARKGQRYLTKQQNRGNADLTKMSPAARAAYLNAQGQVDAQDKSMQDAWTTKFNEMEGGDAARAAEIGRLASTGQLDKNALIAGLGSIKDADQLTAAFKGVHGSEAGKKLLADQKVRSSVAETMKAGDGIINQSMGKVLGKMSNEQFAQTSEAQFKSQVAEKVQGAGTGIMASQSKDVFATEGAADYFSSKQLAAGIGAGYSGTTADNFNSMVSGMSGGERTKIASELSASNASNFTGESLAALGGVDAAAAAAKAVSDAKASGVKDEGQLKAIAEDARNAAVQSGMPAGADIVKANASGAIETLNSEDGARLRANMNSEVKAALGITGDSGSSSGESGGTPAPDNSGDSGGTPAPAAGGWTDDHGTPITSPAQLSDDDLAYANKLKEMSQRSSDGSTLSVDHSSSSSSSGHSSSSSSSSDSSSAPVQSEPPMRGEHGRGINDATGKERAAEGNRLDYHPKQKGETNADYSARTKWEKEMTALGEKAGPRREIIETNGNKRLETHQEWQTRAGIKSFDSWRSGQGGAPKP